MDYKNITNGNAMEKYQCHFCAVVLEYMMGQWVQYIFPVDHNFSKSTH